MYFSLRISWTVQEIFENNNSITNIIITMNDIVLALMAFNYNKSEGLTFINNFIIKNCLNGISKLLFILYNKIIELNELPYELKKSVVSPVLKANKNKHLFTSYRCVSVQPN